MENARHLSIPIVGSDTFNYNSAHYGLKNRSEKKPIDIPYRGPNVEERGCAVSLAGVIRLVHCLTF